jgi:hypothetical protein
MSLKHVLNRNRVTDNVQKQLFYSSFKKFPELVLLHRSKQLLMKGHAFGCIPGIHFFNISVSAFVALAVTSSVLANCCPLRTFLVSDTRQICGIWRKVVFWPPVTNVQVCFHAEETELFCVQMFLENIFNPSSWYFPLISREQIFHWSFLTMLRTCWFVEAHSCPYHGLSLAHAWPPRKCVWNS